MSSDVNITQVPQCLQSTNDFGGTTIHNVCTGIESRVNWGTADWFWNCLGIGVVSAIVLVVLIFVLLGIVMAVNSVAEQNAKDHYYRDIEKGNK